nr:ribonuclease H-like domain-containing protein [Tanacetum cinerariifolium]
MLISQLEILGESLSQKDINLKFLRSLPTEWRTHTLIWRNKTNLEDQSLDDLFNRFRIYEAEVKCSSSSSTSTQNFAFVFSQTTDNTSDPVSVVASVSAAGAEIPVSALPNVDTLSSARTGGNLGANGPTSMGFDMSKVECYNCHRKGHFARECSYDWSFQAEVEPTNYALMAFTSSSSSSSDNEVPSCFKACSKAYATLQYQSRDGYHAVPPPYTGTFMPPKPDLVFHNAPTDNETVYTAFNVKLSATKPDNDLSTTHRPSAPIIEDLVSDSEDDLEAKIPQNASSFVQPSEQVKTPRPSVKTVETSIATTNTMTAIPKPKSNSNRRNRKACFVLLLTKSKLVPITAARPITAAIPNPLVTRPRQAKTLVTKPHLPPRRNINCSPSPKASNFPLKVTAVKTPMVNSAKGNWMCDKKNNVLFTDTECLVLSLEFKLPDESQLLLRVRRENNMYNVDLNNIVPSRDLTCLFAKTALDESNLWHRRLGHINFKTMNKLVKGNLVRGLPTNVFKNDHTCVACKKGKQHRASCKFNGKVDEGFLIGYSVSSKAFRVFNSSTQIVQETLHINFLENKPNVAGEDSVQQYVLFPVWSSGSNNPQNTDVDAAFKVKEPEFEGKKTQSEDHVSPSSSAQTKKHDDKTKREAKVKSHVESSIGYKNLSAEFDDFSDNSINEIIVSNSPGSVVRKISTNSINTFSVAGPSNAVVSLTHGKSSYMDTSQLPDDPNMPELEDIIYSDDEEDVSAEADFTNLETTITVSPIPTTRVHKDHHVT